MNTFPYKSLIFLIKLKRCANDSPLEYMQWILKRICSIFREKKKVVQLLTKKKKKKKRLQQYVDCKRKKNER